MSALQPVRGTRDIMPEETRRQRRVVDTACELAARYGYLEMSTPIFEFTEVFRRPLGETSDVVAKETYTFTDRGGEELDALLVEIVVKQRRAGRDLAVALVLGIENAQGIAGQAFLAVGRELVPVVGDRTMHISRQE